MTIKTTTAELICRALEGLLPSRPIKIYHYKSFGRDIYSLSKLLLPEYKELWGDIVSMGEYTKGGKLSIIVDVDNEIIEVLMPNNLKTKIFFKDAY